jgi:cysteine desulfurase
MNPIYLDFNSTAPLLPEAAAAIAAAHAAGYANPASQHAEGRRARRVLEDAREEIARLLGADLTNRAADRLLFTSGGTEANNLALLGLSGTAQMRSAHIIISTIEHPSVVAAADHLQSQQRQVDRLAVNHDGIVRLDHLEELLSSQPQSTAPALVSVMLANNETGVLEPIAEIVRRCSAIGGPAILLHTDAVQAVGKIPVHFRQLGVAAMTVAPHKFGGPRGIGALLLRHGIEIQPILHGATQQFGLRPGTESVALVLGFLAALQASEKNLADRAQQMAALRDRFEAAILAAHPQSIINGVQSPRLPHTSNVAFVGHNRQAVFMALDLAGICCSTGSACASGSSEPSPTLLAMDLSKDVIDSSLRFSFGPTTTVDEIDETVHRISAILRGQQ